MIPLAVNMFQATLLIISFVVFVIVTLIGVYLTVVTFGEVHKALNRPNKKEDRRA